MKRVGNICTCSSADEAAAHGDRRSVSNQEPLQKEPPKPAQCIGYTINIKGRMDSSISTGSGWGGI
jgi:hypothetical protein